MADAPDDREATTSIDAPLAPQSPKRRHTLRWASLAIVAVGVTAGGIFAWRQVEPVLSARKYRNVTYEVPKAPKLTAKPAETVYRIDPTRSSLTYAVTERFVGRKDSTARGETNGLAGDLAVNKKDLGQSRVGPIVANVEQFHSDNNLRDARLRQDFLQSHRFPLARFELQELGGLKGQVVDGKTYRFTMTGTVTIKGESAEATFDATATMDNGTLRATATTTAKLSRFDAGPVSIAGLVRSSDDVELTLELTAADPSKHDIPTTISGPDAKAGSSAKVAKVSFAKTVKPIIEANCASCHNGGGMAADNLKIDTAADVADISDGIKTVTQTRYMPPWPASRKGVPLAHENTLTDRQIADLAAWADGGGQLDVGGATKVVADEPEKGVLPRQDAELRIEPYLGSLDNTNDYRCFVLDPELTKPMYLTGYTFLADQVQELHHSQVFHISAEQKADSPRLDGEGGEPGWSCYGGPGLRGDRPDTVPGRARNRDVGFAGQANLVAGWVPGQAPVVFPEHSGILLQPGDALVMQLHYHFADTPTRDESGLGLQLEEADADVKAMRVVNPLGPVEIPCAPEDRDEPLCDRDASLADSIERFGPSGKGNEDGLLFLCKKTPEELTKDFDGTVARSTCDLRVPEDGIITGAMGHMHTLGRDLRMTLDPGTAEEQILLDIPRWSFDWQMNYELEEPLHVTAGQKLRLDCSWDRSADPLRPPRYITFAEGTEDEMCFATYSLIPDDQ